ncbi:MAG: hypothetical protein Q8Q09_00695 [Deltaproteobacteria bacterium]|nr:hypothetical protein [Deltaproteobacteria bacterium]
MRWHVMVRVVLGISTFALAGHAQRASEEFRCALLGTEQAQTCLRVAAERTTDAALERAVFIFVQVGDVSGAAQRVEGAYARGERTHVWSAMLAVGQAMRDRGEPRGALAWYERWRETAKREATADVLAAVHTGRGQALLALRERTQAYDAFSHAVHGWRSEHRYRLSDSGQVVSEGVDVRGYVAPEVPSFDRWDSALRLVRHGVLADDVDGCMFGNVEREAALRRCLGALRPRRVRPEVNPRGGGSGIVSPFEGLTQVREGATTHSTRSRLSEASFLRGNTAMGNALFGMLRIQFDALTNDIIPRCSATLPTDYSQRPSRRISPCWGAVFMLQQRVLVPLAQEAIATEVPDVALGAAQHLADAFVRIARMLRELWQLEWSNRYERQPEDLDPVYRHQ